MYIRQLVFKGMGINQIVNGLQFAKVFSAKLPTVLIHQNVLLPMFLLLWYSVLCNLAVYAVLLDCFSLFSSSEVHWQLVM